MAKFSLSLSMKPREHTPSLGQCIFCLTEFPPHDLTDEHVVPLFINGAHMIKKGTCKACAQKFNKTFEQPAARQDFLAPRLILGLRRRNGKVRRALPRVALGADVDVLLSSVDDLKVELEAQRYPPTVVFPAFRPPGLLSGVDRSAGFREVRAIVLPLLRHPKQNLNDLKSPDNPNGRVLTRTESHPLSFLTTVAKIAYCYAVSERGLEGFDGTDIRRLLNGERDDVFNFVGNDEPYDLDAKGRSFEYLHSLYLEEIDGFLTVAVHLFASFAGVEYRVVVGRLIATE